MANQLQDPGVYDQENADNGGRSHPDLGPGHNQAAGDPSDPRGDLRQGEEGAGLFNSEGDNGDDKKKGYDPANIKGREQFTDPNSLYRGGSGGKGGAKSFIKRNRSKLLIGSACGGGIIGMVIGLFFLLIPLKVEHIVTKLEKHFFASSEQYLQDQTETMLSKYVKKHVLPALKECSGSTLDRKCNPLLGNTSDNPVTELYRGWKNARLENKLAENWGIEFKYDKFSKKYYMKVDGVTDTKGEDITRFVNDGKDGDLFQQVSQGKTRREILRSVNNGMEGETRMKKVFYRYKVGRLLSEKYGLKRCIDFCGTKFGGKVENKKLAAKIYLTQRVIIPRNQTVGIVLECLLTGCDATKTSPTDGSESPQLAGSPENPETDTKIRQTLGELAGKYGATDLDELSKAYKEISTEGFQKYLINKALVPVIGEVAAGKATAAVPIVGWIALAVQLRVAADNAGPSIQKLGYVTNSSAAVKHANLYRTYADEIHTGKVDAVVAGSIVDSLGSGDTGDKNDPIVGGTAGAEEAPLYKALVSEGSSTTAASLLGVLLPASASAASSLSANSPDYKCKNGKAVPDGQWVCDEEVFSGGNALANAIDAYFSLPGNAQIGVVAKAAGALIDKVNDAVGGAIGVALQLLVKPLELTCSLPRPLKSPYCDIRDAAEALVPKIAEGVATVLIPSPFSTNMGGGRNVQMITAGNEVSAMETNHTLLGGKKVPASATEDSYEKLASTDREDFARQSLYARMFNTGSDYSLVSNLAMATPLNVQASAQMGFASLISNPIGIIANSFGSLFAGAAGAGPASPYRTEAKGPFGITHYKATPIKDAETYWEKHCDNTKVDQAYQNDTDYAASNWNQAAADNPDSINGMPTNTEENPCLGIKTTTGAAGGFMDSKLLTDDDKAEITGSGSGGSNTSIEGGLKIDEAAASKVVQEASAGGAKVGYALYDEEGKSLANNNDSFQNYGASITKSMLLVAYLDQLGSGNISSEAKGYLTNMIERSDNASANWVYSHLNNRVEAVKKVASDAGMTGFQIDTSDRIYTLGQSKITASDFGKFFAKIDKMMPENQKSFGLELLSHVTPHVGLLEAGLPGTVYSKEGWKPEGSSWVVNQAGQFSSGGKNYGIAVTVKDTTSEASGESIIQKVVSALVKAGK